MDDAQKYKILRSVLGDMRELLVKETNELITSEDLRTRMKALGHAGAAGMVGAIMSVMDELDDGTLEAEVIRRKIMDSFDRPQETIDA